MSVNERGRIIIFGVLTEQGRPVINGLTDGGAVEVGSTTAPFKGASSSASSVVANLTITRTVPLSGASNTQSNESANLTGLKLDISGASNTQSNQSASLSGIKIRMMGESFTYVLMGATKLTSKGFEGTVSKTVSGVSKANLSGVSQALAGESKTVSGVTKANLSGAHVELSGVSITESLAFDAPKYPPMYSRDKGVKRQSISPYSTKTGANTYEREDFIKWDELGVIPYDLYDGFSAEMLIGQDGTIYVGWQVGSYGDSNSQADLMNVPTLLALYPNGTLKWGCHIPSGPRHQVLGSIYKFGEVETLYTYNQTRFDYDGDTDKLNTNYGSNIYAIDCKTGEVKWVYEYNSNLDPTGIYYYDSVTHFDDTGPVTQGVDGTLYAFAGPGASNNPNASIPTVIALNQDGTEKWTVEIGDASYGAYANSIAVGDNALYLNFDTVMYAISFDGYVLWSKKHPEIVYTRKYGSPDEIGTQDTATGLFSAPSVAPDGTIYAGGTNYLWAFNPDGTTKLRKKIPYILLPTDLETLETWGGAVDSQGTYYIGGTGSSDDYLHIIAMESDGTFRWDVQLDNYDTFEHAPPTLSHDEKEIIFNTTYGELLVINTETGVISYRSGENELTESNGTTIIDEKGNVYIVNPWEGLVSKFIPKFDAGAEIICKLVALYDAITREPILPVRLVIKGGNV